MQLEGRLLTLPDYAIANKGFIEAGIARVYVSGIFFISLQNVCPDFSFFYEGSPSSHYWGFLAMPLRDFGDATIHDCHL